MPKIDITKTELVWPGKYNEDGTRNEVARVNLPFQIIETINESRATREARKAPQNLSLFDVYEGKEGNTFEEGWRNKLVWGDNLLIMGALLGNFAGRVDLIYIDPPFATGADFSFTTEIGDSGDEVFKEQSIIEEKAYRDTWGTRGEKYSQWIYDRLILMRDLLAEDGSIYVHLDWRVSHHVKVLMDEVFGINNFRNEIIWHYPGREMHIENKFNAKHDALLFYGRSKAARIRMAAITIPYDRQERLKGLRRKVHKDPDGREWVWETRGQAAGQEPYKRYVDDIIAQGRPISDVWDDLQFLRGNHPERVEYATQKPSWLLERVINASSDVGDLVLDCFCGSGTTLAVAEKLGRRWIGCDLSRWAVHVTRKRLLSAQNCKPFDVLNLGKYERKYWQGVTFGEGQKEKGKRQNEDQQWAIFQYIAFILRLYGAEPLAGMQHLHGKKGKAVVHIGAVDAPVTIDEINACIEECLAVKQAELHVLGWEWEMGLANLMVEEAKHRGVKLLLLNIPREVMEQQAVDKGDIRFFEVAHLEVEIKQDKGRKVTVALKDFAFPYADLISEEVRSKIKKWSDYIDYWAVDWNFQNDTFMNGWVAYRTRKERKLPLASDANVYDKPGKYTIMVKVVDIFGNDTSQIFQTDVK
ncbi:MAG TPA: site-specific DNA-methyltransferase [Deltaproteobacteria bacterium]|nr:site-specific DNA-methyltransferase [Deltaproteobacteria bacterium]